MIKLRGRITIFLIALLLVIIIGMIGFFYLKIEEGGNPRIIDAFSWTIITISTLGSYTSDISLNTNIGQLFTSAVVLLGLSVFFLGIPSLLAPWIEKKVATAIKPKPIPLPDKGHIIICGYGEIIDEVIDAVSLHAIPYLIIESKKTLDQVLQKKKIPHIIGDPTDDNILLQAHIEQALSLIVAMDDESNAFISLSAKVIKKDLRIIVVANRIENIKALYAAGANAVIDPKTLAGSILGRRACHDYTLEVSGKFAMFGDMEVRQYAISSDSKLVNLSIKESHIRTKTGTIIIGLWKEGNLILNPSPDETLIEGTTILVIGTADQFDSFYKLLGGRI